MNKAESLASRLREVLLDGRWIANTNYREQLAALTWQQATAQIGDLNTIAALIYHINYYIAGLILVIGGRPLEIRDKYSFDMPPITSANEWKELVDTFLANAGKFASLVAALPDAKLGETFVEEKYGTWQRNIEGVIEHCYYHLGQVSLIRKTLQVE